MEKLFRLRERGTSVNRELVAGFTTFLTMAYILAVNPGLLAVTGMSAAGVFTATALASAAATLLMGLTANLPIALAPGMGLNAFFTYSVVIGMNYSWQLALTAVFLEGIFFIILSIINVRRLIVEAIPVNLKKAAAVGIGLFIARIGFESSGIIIGDEATLVSLGNFMARGSAQLAIFGLLITIVLYASRIPGSILLGVLITTIIGIPLGVTKIPEGFHVLAIPEAPIVAQFEFSNILNFQFFTVFFTFLFVDIFDTDATLVSVCGQAGLVKHGQIPRVKQAFLADAVGTVVGATLGTTTVTSYVESTAGVAAGGRTGLTAVFSGFLFIAALFFSPVFLVIPQAATAPALIVVGFLMMQAVLGIDLKDPSEGIPAFLAIVIMPLALSIALGLVYGVLSFVVLKTLSLKFRQISLICWALFIIFLLPIVLRLFS